MSAPTNVECVDKTVTLAAQNVVTCRITIKKRSKDYYYTYVDTGDTAPSAPTTEDNPNLDYDELWTEIDNILDLQFLEGTDVYIYCVAGTSGNGYVRVDS